MKINGNKTIELSAETRRAVEHAKAKIRRGNEDFSEYFEYYANIAYDELDKAGQLPTRRAARLSVS